MLKPLATVPPPERPPHTLAWHELCNVAWLKVQKLRFMSASSNAMAFQAGLGHDLALKFNSTSSIHLQDTVLEPDLDELSWCASLAVIGMLSPRTDTSTSPPPELFDETKHLLHMNKLPWPSDYKPPVPPEAPCAEDVFLFINPVLKKLRVKPESVVMCMVYLRRLCDAANFTIDAWTWRWSLLSCLALATKVFEDLAIWNADFKEAFPLLSVTDMNRLEIALLKYLNFSVEVTRSTYAMCFFSLKEKSPVVFSNFLAGPLNERDLSKIEQRSQDARRAWGSKDNLLEKM